MFGKKYDYDTRDIYVRRDLEMAPKNKSIGRNKGNRITNITKKSWNDFDKNGYKEQYWNNEYTYSPFQKIYYSQKNKDLLNKHLQKMVLNKLNVNIGYQNDRMLEERMHEAFHFVFDMHYHEKRSNSVANLRKFALQGYEYKPEDDRKRGIISKPRYNRDWRKFDLHKDEKPLSDEELLKKINRQVLYDTFIIVRDKILSWKYYNKDFNRTVHERKFPTYFKDRPEDEGLNARRKPANINLFRVKPWTYKDRVSDLYRQGI